MAKNYSVKLAADDGYPMIGSIVLGVFKGVADTTVTFTHPNGIGNIGHLDNFAIRVKVTGLARSGQPTPDVTAGIITANLDLSHDPTFADVWSAPILLQTQRGGTVAIGTEIFSSPATGPTIVDATTADPGGGSHYYTLFTSREGYTPAPHMRIRFVSDSAFNLNADADQIVDNHAIQFEVWLDGHVD